MYCHLLQRLQQGVGAAPFRKSWDHQHRAGVGLGTWSCTSAVPRWLSVPAGSPLFSWLFPEHMRGGHGLLLEAATKCVYLLCCSGHGWKEGRCLWLHLNEHKASSETHLP